jgi:Ca-activated chloride channel family protein
MKKNLQMKRLNRYIENIVYVLLLNLMVFALWRYSLYWFEFQYPGFFYLLAIVPLLSIWFVWKSGNVHAEIRLSTVNSFQGIGRSWKVFFKSSWFFFRILTIAALLIAMARPQSKSSWQNVNAEGIDIVIAFDLSPSMLARDFKPNRLEAAREVAVDFIDMRADDRIGLVVFSGEAFTQCPLTTDHRVLKELFAELQLGVIDTGTAIGMGLATAVNRLRESETKSKVIILVTDGVNTAGSIPPLTAAEIAKEYGIRVYTIGVGTRGKALSPVAIINGQYQYGYQDVEIDENNLRQIADMTGGKYFRATNNATLKNIYTEIDKMEKTRLKVTEYSRKKEEFFWYLIAAAGLLLFEFITRNTLFKTIP